MNWQTAPATGLEVAIAEFKARLPGWWFSVAECQVSCDASCAPTAESPHIELARKQKAGLPFDSGFHIDLRQPSTMADALRNVMGQALAALAVEGAQAPSPRDGEATSDQTQTIDFIEDPTQ